MNIFNKIKQDPRVRTYLRKADEHLGEMGFTEHGLRHAELVSNIAKNIMERLEYPERMKEIAAIASFMHDIGNVINRVNHPVASAMMAENILYQEGMAFEEIGMVMGAIGNHDEDSGEIVNPATAALVLADKSDVHRSRVRNPDRSTFDIHDRVNYAVEHSFLVVDAEERTITLSLRIDTALVPLMDYFEIFLTRMLMCRRAAEALECDFRLNINETRLL